MAAVAELQQHDQNLQAEGVNEGPVPVEALQVRVFISLNSFYFRRGRFLTLALSSLTKQELGIAAADIKKLKEGGATLPDHKQEIYVLFIMTKKQFRDFSLSQVSTRWRH